MKENNEVRKLSVADLLARSFGIIMVVLYLVVGTTIIVNTPDSTQIPKPYFLVFGFFLILYGCVRAYKVYRKFFPLPEGEE